MHNKVKIYPKNIFDNMRKSGRLAREVLDYIEPFVKIGISTLKLNDLCHDFIIKNNAIPAPLNYKGFPKSICTSINNVVCHGIPSEDTILQDGDIINLDITVIVDGWYGDTSRTFKVGDSFTKKRPSTIKASQLVDTTFECMWKGIEAIKEGGNVLDIGRAIQTHAEKNNFSVVRDYCGHGIGNVFHEFPSIVHYYPTDKEEIEMHKNIKFQEGMFFTVEPMLNVGGHETILSKVDNWTVRTADKSLSAQFEHTIGITDKGVEILTK